MSVSVDSSPRQAGEVTGMSLAEFAELGGRGCPPPWRSPAWRHGKS